MERLTRRQLAFGLCGLLLVIASVVLGYTELVYALRGSAGAWIALSVLFCVAMLGGGMLREARRSGEDRAAAAGRIHLTKEEL